MDVKILGPGCRNCKLLEDRTREAISNLNLFATITKVEDYEEIAAFGIMATPGLVVDNQVLLSGKVPTVTALEELIKGRTLGQ
jgi:small redox-active disulfide protein 2